MISKPEKIITLDFTNRDDQPERVVVTGDGAGYRVESPLLYMWENTPLSKRTRVFPLSRIISLDIVV